MSPHKAAAGFTPSVRGFSAIHRELSAIDLSRLSGSVGSRKPLSHIKWLESASQISMSLFPCEQLEFDFMSCQNGMKVWVPCNTHTLSDTSDFSC